MEKFVLLVYVLFSSGALILLKLGTVGGLPVKFINGHLSFNLNLPNLLGMIMYIASFFIWIYLISKSNLSYIVPVSTALVYIVLFLGAYLIFKETFTVAKIIGIVLIFIGIVFLNLGK